MVAPKPCFLPLGPFWSVLVAVPSLKPASLCHAAFCTPTPAFVMLHTTPLPQALSCCILHPYPRLCHAAYCTPTPGFVMLYTVPLPQPLSCCILYPCPSLCHAAYCTPTPHLQPFICPAGQVAKSGCSLDTEESWHTTGVVATLTSRSGHMNRVAWKKLGAALSHPHGRDRDCFHL